MKVPSLRSLAAIGVAVFFVVIASSPLTTVFIGVRATVAVTVAATFALTVSALFWRVGFSGAPVVFGHAAVLLVTSGLLLFGTENFGPGLFGEAWQAATGGWIELLRRRVPTEPSGSLLMPPVVLAWVVIAIVSELVLRTDRAVVGLVPLVVGAYGFLLLGVGESDRVLIGFVLAILLLTYLWLTTSEGGEARPDGSTFAGIRSLALAVGVGAVALLIGGAAASLLVRTGDRWDPRLSVVPPVEVQAQSSPLSLLKAQLVGDTDETLFTVEIDGPELPTGSLYFRTVALETYDGVLWSSQTTFPVVGSTLEPADVPGETVSVRVSTEADYESQFVPVLGDPRFIGLDDAGYSAETDTLAMREPAAGVEFELRAHLVTADDDEIASARPSGGEADQAFLRFEDRAESTLGLADDQPTITDLVAELSAPFSLDAGDSTGRQLLSLRQQLQDGFTRSTQTPSGHSIASLRQYAGIAENPTIDFPAKVGYAEQAAALFAVVARESGFPTRVAVGYRVIDAVPGEFVVTEKMAWAWPEVHLDGLGWVPIEATTSITDDSIEAPSAPIVVQPSVAVDGAPGDIGEVNPDPIDTVDGGWFLWWWLAAPLVFVPVLPWLSKAVRRQRRLRANAPPRQVMAYWIESRDRLRDLGVPVSPAFTPREVVGMAKRVAVVDEMTSLDPLAVMTDQSLYAPDEVTMAEVERAAALEKLFRSESAGHTSTFGRILGRLGLRSLLPMRMLDEVPPPVFAEVAEI